MNVLVTGATGFIGTHVTKALLARGHTVAALVRPGSNTARLGNALPNVRLIAGDLGTLSQTGGASALDRFDTEVCVHTTVREGNDRGYRCIVPGDCCASYFPEFHETGLRMIKAQGGIFGWVSDSARVLAAFG